MKEMAKDRRAKKTDDLTSKLLDADIEGEALDEKELASFFVLLVVAGNETTRNAISHGMKALCDHPEERRKWAADFEGVAPTAVEEIVRWASPVIFMRRTLTQDYVLSGKQLREGDKTVLWYNSGNRDASVFDDPYRFDVTRTPNEHVAFGGFGTHFCLGASLARLELRVMFEELLRRLPDIELATDEPLPMRPNNFIVGIEEMPVRFTPTRGSE